MRGAKVDRGYRVKGPAAAADGIQARRQGGGIWSLPLSVFLAVALHFALKDAGDSLLHLCCLGS